MPSPSPVIRRALIGLVVLAAGLAVVSPAARAALPDPRMVSVLSPSEDAVVTKRSVRVVLRVNRPVRRLRVYLGRRDVTKRLRPAGRNRRRGVISGLQRGRNVLHVESVARNGRRGSTFASFNYARRQRGLVRVGAPARSSSPVRVSARVPRDMVRFVASLNGKRVEDRFSLPVRRTRRASLSASDGLRFGRNVLRVRVVRDSELRDRASYDEVRRRFVVPRSRPLVGAGVDRSVRTRQRLRLDGRASRPHAQGRGCATAGGSSSARAAPRQG